MLTSRYGDGKEQRQTQRATLFRLSAMLTMWGGQGGGRPGEKGAGEVREAGEKRAGSGSSKMAGCGNEM